MKSQTPGDWGLINSRQRLLEFCQEQPCFTNFTCTPYGRGQWSCKLVIRIFSVFKEYTSSHHGRCRKQVIDRASMKLVHKIFKIGLIEHFGQPRTSLLSGNQIPTFSNIEVARQAASAFLSQGSTNTQPIVVHEPSTPASILTEDNTQPIVVHEPSTPASILTEYNNLPLVVHEPSISANILTEDNNLPVVVHEPSTPASILTEDNNLPVVVHEPSTPASSLTEDNNLPVVVHEPSTPASILTEDNNLPVVVHEPSTPASILTEDNNLPVVHEPSTPASILTEDNNLPVVVHEPSTPANILMEEAILEDETTEKDTTIIKKMLCVEEGQSVEDAVDAVLSLDVEQLSEILNNYGEELRTRYVESMEKKSNNIMLGNATVWSKPFNPQYGKFYEPNQDLLDIILLLAISPALRLSFNHHSGTESNLFYKICKCFDDSLTSDDDEYVEREMKKALKIVYGDVWKYMDQMNAANDYSKLLAHSPAAGLKKVLETLIISEHCIHKAFENQVRWTFRCRNCHYEEPDATERVGPFTFPHISKSFHPFSKEAFSRGRCLLCGSLGYRSNLTFEKLAPCFVMHFEDKFPITCLAGFDFKVHGATYKLTSFLSADGGGVWLRKRGGWHPLNANAKCQTKKCKENARLLLWEREGAKQLLNEVPTTTDLTNFFKPLTINPGTRTYLMRRFLKRGRIVPTRTDVTISYPEKLDPSIGDLRLPPAEEILATDNLDQLLAYAGYRAKVRRLPKKLMKQIRESEEYCDVVIDLNDEKRNTRSSRRKIEPGALCEDQLFLKACLGDSGDDLHYEPKPKKVKEDEEKEADGPNVARSSVARSSVARTYMAWNKPTSNLQLLDDDQMAQFRKDYAENFTTGKPTVTSSNVKERYTTCSESTRSSRRSSCSLSTTTSLEVVPVSVIEKVVTSPTSSRGSSRGSTPDLDSVVTPGLKRPRKLLTAVKLPVSSGEIAPVMQSTTPVTKITDQHYSLTNILCALDEKSAHSILQNTPDTPTPDILPPGQRRDDGFRRGDGMNFAPFAFKKSKKTKK